MGIGQVSAQPLIGAILVPPRPDYLAPFNNSAIDDQLSTSHLRGVHDQFSPGGGLRIALCLVLVLLLNQVIQKYAIFLDDGVGYGAVIECTERIALLRDHAWEDYQ